MWALISGLAMAIDGPTLDWVVVNDTVMGGVSTGRVTIVDDTVRWTGELSLEQNGGFASIRSTPRDLELAGVSGFRLRLRGDGRTYDFTARRADVPIRAGSYRVRIETTADTVIEISVPLAAFEPVSFGRPITGVPRLADAPERIDSVGFLLADKQPGPFALEVLEITPVE